MLLKFITTPFRVYSEIIACLKTPFTVILLLYYIVERGFFMENLHKDRNIWARLNNPDLTIEEADAVIFGIPYDKGVSFRSGSSLAPN